MSPYQEKPLSKILNASLAAAIGVACAAGVPDPSPREEAAAGQADAPGFIEEGSWDAEAILRLANTAPLETLKEAVNSWAATAIVNNRPFTTIAQLDDLTWVGWFSLWALDIYATDNGYGPIIAEEYAPAGEDEAIQASIEAIREHMQRAYSAGVRPVHRDAHAKAHGCVQATFAVDNRSLPDAMRVGVFAENKEYSAVVRFSNGNFDVQADDVSDARGIAVKLLGVPGAKILGAEKDALTQDFVLISQSAFFSRNAPEYVALNKAAHSKSSSSMLEYAAREALNLRLRGLLNAAATLPHIVTNPLSTRYWSMTPYRLGAEAVKYTVMPCNGQDDLGFGVNALRDAMTTTLSKGDACFQFAVQQQLDARDMPIEDPTIRWSESASPPIPVAMLRIPKQTFDSTEWQTGCENLSFTPWHSLPEHAPLGGINRARKTIYEEVSKLRHAMNGAPRQEPTAR